MKVTGWLVAGGMAAIAGLRLLPQDYHRLQIAAEGTRDVLLAPAPVLAAVAAARRRPALALAFAALTVELVRGAPGCREQHRLPPHHRQCAAME
jgi:hypothetical protein